MGRNMGTVTRWITNKVQPSVEQLYDIARLLDVDVKDLLISSKQNEGKSLWYNKNSISIRETD